MFEEITEKLKNGHSIGIFVHINPDGDALGSAFSLKEVLKDMGKTADVFYCGSVEPCLKKIFSLDNNSDNDLDIKSDNYDLLVALDCADINRLGEYKDYFAEHNNTAAIDHHITHVPYAQSTVVKEISSTCELIYDMYKEMRADISLTAAEYLYVGIMTDTGSFKFSCADGDTHRAAAELIDMGVDFAGLSKLIFDTKSKEYLQLYAYAINNTKFYLGGKAAVLRLSEDDFKRFGISEAAASAIVSVPGQIEGVKLGVYVRDRQGECKVSLRSSGEVNVSELACRFGGGGHICAAGYSVSAKDADSNIKELISIVSESV